MQNVYEGMGGIKDRVNDSPLVPCVQRRGEHPLWTVYPLHIKFVFRTHITLEAPYTFAHIQSQEYRINKNSVW